MKILMLIDSFVLGGAQRQFSNLALSLNELGDEITICVYYPIQGAFPEQHKHLFDISCFDKSFKYDLSPVLKLSRKIKSVKPDVVVAFLATPSVYAELSRLTGHSIPIIVSERNGPGEHTGFLKERLLVAMHSLAKGVVFNNHGHHDDLIGKYPSLRTKSHVIYNGVDQRYFQNKKLIDDDICRGLNDIHNNDPFKFCVVSARPIERKGLFELIKAMSILKNKSEKPFSVHWIGACDESDPNVRQVNYDLEQFELESQWCWKGVNTDLYTIYKNYDALLVPSRREGVSNVLCEAMSVGLPCIASDIVDHRTIIQNSGSGLLFEVRNAMKLAQCMEQFMNEDATKLAAYGNQARTFAEDNFSMQRYAYQWKALLQNAVSN